MSAPAASGGGMVARALRNYIRQAAVRTVKSKQPEKFKWKIVQGDTVKLISGRDAGKTGIVRKVDRRRGTVIVGGLHMAKRAIKPTETTAGGIISVESPVHYSNITLLDPTDALPTKVEYRWTRSGQKVRVSKRTGNIVPYPKIADRYVHPLRPAEPGPRDTPAKLALAQTYKPPQHLIPYLSPAASRAATRPQVVAARPMAGTASIFRERRKAHGDKVSVVMKLKLRRKNRVRIAAKEAKAAEDVYAQQIAAVRAVAAKAAAAAAKAGAKAAKGGVSPAAAAAAVSAGSAQAAAPLR